MYDVEMFKDVVAIEHKHEWTICKNADVQGWVEDVKR